jgi:hypothetical protein
VLDRRGILIDGLGILGYELRVLANGREIEARLADSVPQLFVRDETWSGDVRFPTRWILKANAMAYKQTPGFTRRHLQLS